MINRHMRTRTCEHIGISPLTGANFKPTSVAQDHFILTGHTISFDDFIILRSVPNTMMKIITIVLAECRDLGNPGFLAQCT